MPSSSLSWQQGLAGRNPAISFLTSAENEMPTTSQGWCPAPRTLFLPSSPPKVQSTEPVTARAPGTDLQPHTLLALYHTSWLGRECASTVAAAVDNVWSRDKESG